MSTMPAIAAADPAIASQAAFRAIMSAMAQPGTIWPLQGVTGAPKAMSPGLAGFAAAMIDHDTPVWLDATLSSTPDVADWLRFYTGARADSEPAKADFALIGDPSAMPPFDAFCLGTPEYPDRSTTLVLQVRSLHRGLPLTLAGPGIATRKTLRADPLPADMAQRLATNRGLFPRGIDIVLIADGEVAALPRSVRTTPGDA
jgi:alpha-D-ribose 1-methylphosphonate 5-triphosphate synthase subunit PhnH